MLEHSVDDHRWRRATARAGVDYRVLYNLRHTYTTLMIRAGKPLQWIAHQLGHVGVKKIDDGIRALDAGAGRGTARPRWGSSCRSCGCRTRRSASKVCQTVDDPIREVSKSGAFSRDLEEHAPAGNRTRTIVPSQARQIPTAKRKEIQSLSAFTSPPHCCRWILFSSVCGQSCQEFANNFWSLRQAVARHTRIALRRANENPGRKKYSPGPRAPSLVAPAEAQRERNAQRPNASAPTRLGSVRYLVAEKYPTAIRKRPLPPFSTSGLTVRSCSARSSDVNVARTSANGGSPGYGGVRTSESQVRGGALIPVSSARTWTVAKPADSAAPNRLVASKLRVGSSGKILL
jgi:hypothetical protein